jgi:hypothetical protein
VRVQKTPRVTGTCHPTHVHFDGIIETDGPAFVTYRWIRSDGKRTDGVVRFTEGFKGRGVGTTWDQAETTTSWCS